MKLVNANVAVILCTAITLVKVYPEEIAAASSAEESAEPSTVTEATEYPVAGVKVNDWFEP